MTRQEQLRNLLQENKRAMVRARLADDAEAAIRLSAEKERLKKRLNHYCHCGSRKNPTALRCRLCYIMDKKRGKKLRVAQEARLG